jgi:hypothetical protein
LVPLPIDEPSAGLGAVAVPLPVEGLPVPTVLPPEVAGVPVPAEVPEVLGPMLVDVPVPLAEGVVLVRAWPSSSSLHAGSAVMASAESVSGPAQ